MKPWILLSVAIAVTFAGPALSDSGTDRQILPDRSWPVRADSTLRGTLEAWSAREGWDLVWDARNDYRLRAAADLGPDFLTAIRSLADAVNMTSPDLTVTLYLGNRVIHVRDTLLTHN